MKPSQPGAVATNLGCFAAMIMWAVGFPAAEVLLQSWGAIALVTVRLSLGVALLLLLWSLSDGWKEVRHAPWRRGLGVGGIGFGFGAILLLVGQQMSDPVTPAIAAAMMPIAGAVLEVVLDHRKLRAHLLLGIVLAVVGGLLATGLRLVDGTFGQGAVLCLAAIVLFAWATRATTRNFSGLSPLGQTTITLVGALVFVILAHAAFFLLGSQEVAIGAADTAHIVLLLVFALVSAALAQLLWIWGAGGLGILLASFHMNAVPFYVMVIMVLFLGESWDWMQAAGAAMVATGVMVSQWGARVRR